MTCLPRISEPASARNPPCALLDGQELRGCQFEVRFAPQPIQHSEKCAPTSARCCLPAATQPSYRCMRPLLPGLVGRNSEQAACGGLDWRFSSPRYLSLLAIPCMFPVSYGLNLTRAREAARCFITGVVRGTLALFSRTTGVNCGPGFGSLTGCSVRGRLLAQGVARRVWLRRCIDDHPADAKIC